LAMMGCQVMGYNNNNNMSAGSSIYCCKTWDKISRILLTRQSPSIIRASSFPSANGKCNGI
jgi:hypothetical protein